VVCGRRERRKVTVTQQEAEVFVARKEGPSYALFYIGMARGYMETTVDQNTHSRSVLANPFINHATGN
jgi:hypothetical protein